MGRISFIDFDSFRRAIKVNQLSQVTSMGEFFLTAPLAGPRWHRIGNQPIVASVIPKICARRRVIIHTANNLQQSRKSEQSSLTKSHPLGASCQDTAKSTNQIHHLFLHHISYNTSIIPTSIFIYISDVKQRNV